MYCKGTFVANSLIWFEWIQFVENNFWEYMIVLCLLTYFACVLKQGKDILIIIRNRTGCVRHNLYSTYHFRPNMHIKMDSLPEKQQDTGVKFISHISCKLTIYNYCSLTKTLCSFLSNLQYQGKSSKTHVLTSGF